MCYGYFVVSSNDAAGGVINYYSERIVFLRFVDSQNGTRVM